MSTIGFAGLSHLGIVSSIAAAAKGFDVVGFDVDSQLCKQLSLGNVPILEPNLNEILDNHKSRITYSDSPEALAACDILYISLDVDTDQEGQSDLANVEKVVEKAIAFLKEGCIIVVLCQVPPGYTRRFIERYQLQINSKQCKVFYQVETLVFGNAVERALHPERFIIGSSDPGAPLPPLLDEFLGVFSCPVLLMRYESAELAKISINMFLAASVSMSNSLAELCEKIGADWSEIVPALRLDRRIGEFAYLIPGLGIAGGNIERDLVSVGRLAQEYGADCDIVHSILQNSLYRRDWVLRVLREHVLEDHPETIVAIWGLAYKKDTKSVKNSPSLALIEALADFSIQAYDPAVDKCAVHESVQYMRSSLDACSGAGALAIMTPWNEFASVDLGEVREVMAGDLIVDPYRILDPAACAKRGFRHIRIGVSAKVQADDRSRNRIHDRRTGMKQVRG